jgi:hypothetical protein
VQQVEAGTRKAAEAKSLAEECKAMSTKSFDESIRIANAAKLLANGLNHISTYHLDSIVQKKGLRDRERG